MQRSAPEEPRLTFTVVAARNGRRFRIIVKERDRRVVRVSNIKRNLAHVAHIPVEQQVLELDGVVLGDRTTGADINLGSETVLTLKVLGEDDNYDIEDDDNNNNINNNNIPEDNTNNAVPQQTPELFKQQQQQQQQQQINEPVNKQQESPEKGTVQSTRLSEVLARGIVLTAVKHERQKRERIGLEATEAELAEQTHKATTAINQAWREILALSGEHVRCVESVGEAIARYQDLEYQLSNPDALTVFLGMRAEADWESENGGRASVPGTIEKLRTLVNQMEAERSSLEAQLVQEAKRRHKLRVQFEELLGTTRMYLRLTTGVATGGDARVLQRDSTSCNIIARSNQRITVQFDKIFMDDVSLTAELSRLSSITLDGYSLILAASGNRALECLGNGAIAGALVEYLFQTAHKEHRPLVIESACLTVKDSSVIDVESRAEVGVCNGTPVGLHWTLCLDDGDAVASFVKVIDTLGDSGRESSFVIRITSQGLDDVIIQSYIYIVFSQSPNNIMDMASLGDGSGNNKTPPQDPLARFQLAVSPPEDVFYSDVIIVDDTDSDNILRTFEARL